MGVKLPNDLGGKWFGSDSMTLDPGDTIDVKLGFLAKALKQMTFPEVDAVIIDADVNVDTGGTYALAGEDRYRIIDRLQIEDGGPGPLVDLRGESIYLGPMTVELGDANVQPSDIATGQSNTAADFQAFLPFRLPYTAHGPHDTRPPVKSILGGAMTLTISPAAVITGANVDTGGAYRVWAHCSEGRTKRPKSRMTWRDIPVTQQADRYKVDGRLRAAFLYAALANGEYDSWAAYTAVESDALQLHNSFPTRILTAWHKYNSRGVDGTNSKHLNGYTLPLWMPKAGQQIGQLPDLHELDLDLGAAPPSNARLVLCTIADRNPHVVADYMGYESAAQLEADIAKRGRVLTPKGGKPASAFDPRLARHLPLDLRAKSVTGG